MLTDDSLVVPGILVHHQVKPNIITECPHCSNDYGFPVALEYAGGAWHCPECGEEFD